VVSARVHAIYLAMVDPHAGLPLIERSTELARTRGLTEQAGWGLLASAEVRLVIGAWDEALVQAERALALAERNAYLRLAFRTWMVILPMAAARRHTHLADRFDAWWARATDEFPASPSPYAAILRAALPLWLAAARGVTPAPAPDSVLEAWAPIGNPHILAALELIAASWARAGRLEPLRGLVEQAAANVASDDDPDPLMGSSTALMSAILADATGDSDGAQLNAKLALEHASGIGAAWWQSRALRILGSEAEAQALERPLGIVV
jgi:hypothetical protein